ncbi:MAG: hypothetical protein CVT66_03855 [Actinobacteria bacterium HGW-Actinobacteria-6]|nr:MAG: hypothetical protein CVT66_03855 [Actinobacteria bacterium HGW-Actinobacteria-6]
MTSLAEMVVVILEPYVGQMVADTCVRATALSLGKSADELQGADMPALESNVKRLLGPIAPMQTIEHIVAEIEGGIR